LLIVDSTLPIADRRFTGCDIHLFVLAKQFASLLLTSVFETPHVKLPYLVHPQPPLSHTAVLHLEKNNLRATVGTKSTRLTTTNPISALLSSTHTTGWRNKIVKMQRDAQRTSWVAGVQTARGGVSPFLYHLSRLALHFHLRANVKEKGGIGRAKKRFDVFAKRFAFSLRSLLRWSGRPGGEVNIWFPS
jgi:hypothetical protein